MYLIHGALLLCSKRVGLPHWASKSGEAGAVDEEGLFSGFRLSKDLRGAVGDFRELLLAT